jgi:PilZ domain
MNGERDVKKYLKNVLRDYLNNAASPLFIDKSLTIIDESADNKESFIAAALKISKRTALFINKDLAQTVYENLIAAVEKIDLPPGTRRKYRRVAFGKKVRVRHNGKSHELVAENLSEGGMFIKIYDPFPAGSELEVTLSLNVGGNIHVKGCVKRAFLSETPKCPRGMGIEFKEIRSEDMEMLRHYILKVPIQAIL